MLNKASIYYKQVQLLLEVLPFVSKEECFALKGGTAINMFVRDMPRLSVDIDLMYLPVEDREISLEKIALSFERIAKSIETSMRSAKVHRLAQREDEILSKLQVERNGVNIKIEASPVMRGTVREPSVLSVSASVEEEFGFAETSVVHIDDLYAGKRVQTDEWIEPLAARFARWMVLAYERVIKDKYDFGDAEFIDLREYIKEILWKGKVY